MRDAVLLEKRQKPVVVAITEEFVVHGRNVANTEGHANMRQLVFPYPLEGMPEEEIGRIATRMYPQLLQSLGVRT